MKIIILSILLISMVFADTKMLYKADINSTNAFNMIKKDKNIFFIDIRKKYEFAFKHPFGSVNIEFLKDNDLKEEIMNKNFIDEISLLVDNETDAKIILICRIGRRSKLASNILAKNGFDNIYNIKDGFQNDWNKKKLPSR